MAAKLQAAGLAAGLILVPGASAATAAPVEAAQQCPDVVAVAARGSDQNAEEGEYLGPQTYGGRTSNGFEGRNLAAFFHFVDATHPGVMSRVQVLALDDKAYPATMKVPPLAREGETLSAARVFTRIGEILRQYSLIDIVHTTTLGVWESLRTGQNNAPNVVDAYEATTGCAPRYVIVGYSQGAIVGASLERHLAGKGRLAGTVYLGNPLHRPAGMAVLYPLEQARLDPGQRVDYCLSGDFSCQLTWENAFSAMQDKAARHASYFLDAAGGEPTPADAKVAQKFAGWVENPGERPAKY